MFSVMSSFDERMLKKKIVFLGGTLCLRTLPHFQPLWVFFFHILKINGSKLIFKTLCVALKVLFRHEIFNGTLNLLIGHCITRKLIEKVLVVERVSRF